MVATATVDRLYEGIPNIR